MNINAEAYEIEAQEAMNREHTWITETIIDIWNQAFDANKIYDPEVIRLDKLARDFHSRLRTEDGYARDFFHTMESLKGILGDLRRAIHNEQLAPHIQRLLEEERRGFGLEY